MDNEERWLPATGFEGWYEVSNGGRVRSLDRMARGRNQKLRLVKGRTLKWKFAGKYAQVALCVDGVVSYRYVHRLVAFAFLGEPDDPALEVCHNNGDPTDNRVENLRWDTRSENHLDKRKHGTSRANAKLSAEDVREIRTLLRQGVKQADAASLYGVTQTNVSQIARGETWSDI